MGVCLCISVCTQSCLCHVPSSISPLPFSDDLWSSISIHSPDWCCAILCWKARIVVLIQRHAYYNRLSLKKRDIAMLITDGELSKCFSNDLIFRNFFANVPWLCMMCFGKQTGFDNAVFLEWMWSLSYFMQNGSAPWLTDFTSFPDWDASELLSGYIWSPCVGWNAATVLLDC